MCVKIILTILSTVDCACMNKTSVKCRGGDAREVMHSGGGGGCGKRGKGEGRMTNCVRFCNRGSRRGYIVTSSVCDFLHNTFICVHFQSLRTAGTGGLFVVANCLLNAH